MLTVARDQQHPLARGRWREIEHFDNPHVNHYEINNRSSYPAGFRHAHALY